MSDAYDADRTAGDDQSTVAWVESPLQFLAAAEYAAAHGIRPVVAYRISGPQMWTTAEELRRRGAPFSDYIPFVGIPWSLLAQRRTWLIGDVLSGQFRAAAAVLRPRHLTVLDDGDMTIHIADALLGREAFSRRGQTESGLHGFLGGLASDRLLGLAARDRLDVFTAFASAEPLRALASTGVTVEENRFAWLRGHGSAMPVPHPRVVLGTAAVTDGILATAAYLDWVRAVALEAPVSYLPHRRETEETLDLVRVLPGVTVVESDVPVELALAGTAQPLEVMAYRSSALSTLELVLAGSGSRIREAAAAL